MGSTEGPLAPGQAGGLAANEPLIGGFALLRAVQLLNFDIYYLGFGFKSSEAARLSRLGDIEAASRLQLSSANTTTTTVSTTPGANSPPPPPYYRTFLDDLAEYNPVQKYIDRYRMLDALCKFLKICLSLSAIMLGFDKTISTIVLCLSTKIELVGLEWNAASRNMGLLVLILVNFSSMYILFSTIFNGHLLWNLLSQRLFLVSRKFQYKTILVLLVFIYLEYIINIIFINNLYQWDFTSNNIQSGSYSVFSGLRIFVTEEDREHYYIDILLTIFQFARGVIRISPYITINYAIICLKEHISTIRNQHLLTDSLKKRQKLGLVVINRQGGKPIGKIIGASKNKKRVNFVTEQMTTPQRPGIPAPLGGFTRLDTVAEHVSRPSRRVDDGDDVNYLTKIGSFEELESYITNLYIFTGRLNRFMSRQGLTVFFIVHNLVISASVIVPEAVRGGILMAYLIRALVVVIGIVPFVVGQSLNGQLAQLSKQIDRIIIQQQFIHRRRDNLVRIRELIHDIRVNCGGMLNFNVETGIKYLVIAFASAFFIEQEHYKLTRRH